METTNTLDKIESDDATDQYTVDGFIYDTSVELITNGRLSLKEGKIVFSRKEFHHNVVINLKEIAKDDARFMVQKIISRVRLLPNTVSDITTYLRKEQLKLLDKLEQADQVNHIFDFSYYSYLGLESELAEWILNMTMGEASSWRDWIDEKLKDTTIPQYGDDKDHIMSCFFDSSDIWFKKCVEPLLTLLVIRWIRRQIWICEHVGIDNASYETPNQTPKNSITQRQLALCYVYLHLTECLHPFDNHPDGKIAAYQSVTQPYGFSWKSFQIQYNRYLSSPSQRKDRSNVNAIKSVLPFLDPYPEAQKFAQDELKIALSRTS